MDEWITFIGWTVLCFSAAAIMWMIPFAYGERFPWQ